MDVLSFSKVPTLKRPILLLAFAGWNDAGNAATFAAKFLLQRLQGQNFATLDPEIFYNFSEQRPHVRFSGGEREIIWPANEFAYASDPQLAQDIIIALGVEPHLQWRRYIDSVLKVIEECGVELVVTLGALLADVAYAKPVRLTGSASDAELAQRLHLSPSRYEGPTGIVGVLHDTCRRRGLPALSIVQRVLRLLDFSTDLSDLERAAGEFDRRVSDVLASDPKVAEYVRRLEERDEDEDDEDDAIGNTNDLPSGDELARELEAFLREQRREQDDEE